MDVVRNDSWITLLTGGVIAGMAYIFGGIDKLFTALVVFMAVDYVTGITAGYFQKNISSKKALYGLGKKSYMLCLVIIANQVDIIAGSDTGFMRNAMIMFLIGTEGVSILENCGEMGLPIPKFLLDAFERFRGK